MCKCNPFYTGNSCENFKGCSRSLNRNVCKTLLQTNRISRNQIPKQIIKREAENDDSFIDDILVEEIPKPLKRIETKDDNTIDDITIDLKNIRGEEPEYSNDIRLVLDKKQDDNSFISDNYTDFEVIVPNFL